MIDTDKWELVSADASKAVFTKSAVLENWSGTQLTLRLDRSVSLLDDSIVEKELGFKLPDSVSLIAFSSENILTNTGDFE